MYTKHPWKFFKFHPFIYYFHVRRIKISFTDRYLGTIISFYRAGIVQAKVIKIRLGRLRKVLIDS